MAKHNTGRGILRSGEVEPSALRHLILLAHCLQSRQKHINAVASVRIDWARRLQKWTKRSPHTDNRVVRTRCYSFSNPWLVNLSVRLFSVTVRTTWSGAPEGISASTSSV